MIFLCGKKEFQKWVVKTLEEILAIVTEILAEVKKSRRAVAVLFTCVALEPTKFFLKGVTQMQMTDIQTAVAHIEAVDAEGNPATLPSAPTWESSDPSIVTVQPAPDGLSCVIGSPSPAPLGSAVVTVTAGAISGTLAVDIVGSDAVQINITTDAPTP